MTDKTTHGDAYEQTNRINWESNANYGMTDTIVWLFTTSPVEFRILIYSCNIHLSQIVSTSLDRTCIVVKKKALFNAEKDM